MTPADIYAAAFVEADHYIEWLVGCYYTHVPEVAQGISDLPSFDETKRVEVRLHAEIKWDERRSACLRSVWIDGEPVMVCVNAGREGDDHHARWITSADRYKDLLLHLNSIRSCRLPDGAVPYVYLDAEIPEMTEFYGVDLAPLLGQRTAGR